MLFIDRAVNATWWYSSPWTVLLMLALVPFVIWGGYWLNQRIGRRYGLLVIAVVIWVLLMLPAFFSR